MEGKVSVLLVGIGGYGENYLKEFLTREIPGAVLAAIADPYASGSHWYSEIEKRGIPVYSSPEDFFRENRADLTVISSPIHTHYGYILTALRHKSNVLCEKPVTVSVERMEELEKAERESGRFVAVGYQLCFARDVLSLKKRAVDGEFGRPLRMKGLRMMRRTDSYYSRTGWAGRLSAGGEFVFDSPLSNACAHQIQAMLFLSGSAMDTTATVRSVEAVLSKARRDIENYDSAAVSVETEEGVSILYFTSHSLDDKKVGPLMEMEYEKASIVSSDDNFRIIWKDGREEDLSVMEKGERLQKLYDAVECTLGGRCPAVTLKTAKEHVRTVLLAQEKPVYLRADAVRKTGADGDGWWSLPGIREEYLECYREWKLPGKRI